MSLMKKHLKPCSLPILNVKAFFALQILSNMLQDHGQVMHK